MLTNYNYEKTKAHFQTLLDNYKSTYDTTSENWIVFFNPNIASKYYPNYLINDLNNLFRVLRDYPNPYIPHASQYAICVNLKNANENIAEICNWSGPSDYPEEYKIISLNSLQNAKEKLLPLLPITYSKREASLIMFSL